MTKFTVEIELGNEAMSTKEDVAQALRALAERVELIDGRIGTMNIRDISGNTVGYATVVPS